MNQVSRIRRKSSGCIKNRIGVSIDHFQFTIDWNMRNNHIASIFQSIPTRCSSIHIERLNEILFDKICPIFRSEERRVGKECRAGWAPARDREKEAEEERRGGR